MKKGMTLIELLVAITIISIMASATIPITRTAIIRSREYELKNNLRTLRRAIDEYKQGTRTEKTEEEEEEEESEEKTKGNYPQDLQVLVDERYLRRIPSDPFSKETGEGYNSNWKIILFSEDEEGIYDVYSGSKQLSLGGTPYEEW